MTGRYRRVAALICFVCCVLCSTLSVTAAVADQEKRHVIKVGYIDYDGFITEEKDGTYTGYGVEYLRKLQNIPAGSMNSSMTAGISS